MNLLVSFMKYQLAQGPHAPLHMHVRTCTGTYMHVHTHSCLYTCQTPESIPVFFAFWLRRSSLLRRLSLVAAGGGFSSLQLTSFSLQWLHRPSGWGTWASSPRGMWDLPGSGIKPLSTASADGLLTAEPPAKPPVIFHYHFGFYLTPCLAC